MAAKKKAAKAAPKKAPAAKNAASSKTLAKKATTTGAVLSASDVRVLEALPSAYDVGPNERLADELQNARNAYAAFTAYAKPLVAGSKLTASTGKDLAAAMARYEAAERVWNSVRSSAPSVVEARKEAEALKGAMLTGLRYFLRDDKAVQSRCDKIVEGTGDIDLADDLVKLVDLTSEHAPALTKAKIPKGAAARAAVLADVLTEGATKRRGTPEEIAAYRLRNRAFHAMAALIDAIFEAGRYVFQNEPKALKLFRRVARPVRRRRPL